MLQPGQRLDDFEIIRLLGRGGMGEVYEAQQHHPERRVALKVLAPWLVADHEARDRFCREGNALAQLDHPGIVRIIATGAQDEIVYYVMQLIQGISLAALVRLTRDSGHAGAPRPATAAPPTPISTWPEGSGAVEVTAGAAASTANAAGSAGNATQAYRVRSAPTSEYAAPPLPANLPECALAYWSDRFRTVARIGLEVAQALASTHRLGLVHRDIKPSNVMLDQHNHACLVDFGLTRALDSAAVTRTGQLVGTPWYMSPEQAKNLPLDCRSDVYSLGVTLYQLATVGQGPYSAPRHDSGAVLAEIRAGSRQPIEQLAPTIPPALAQIITQAMAQDPAQRYASAAELATDLERFLQTGASPYPLLPAPRRRRLLVGGAAVALVAATIVAVLWLRQPQPPADPPEPKPPIVPAVAVNDTQPFHKRVRPLTLSLPLLRDDNLPDLHRVVLGNGTLQPFPKELVLQTLDRDKPFLVALDDPGDMPFEFAVEARPRAEQLQVLLGHQMGIFFGWRDQAPDPRGLCRFFVATLDIRPTLGDVGGRLQLGTWCFSEPGPNIAVPFEQEPAALLGETWTPLPQGDEFRLVRVRVQGKKLTVRLDNAKPVEADLGELIRQDPKLAGAHVQLHGAVGLWVRNGLGHFRNATIKALPRE